LEVYRVRGKNLVWLALIALVASVLLSGVSPVSFAQEGGTIYINPPLVTGYLNGDTFDLDIDISDAEDIYAWEFSLDYPEFLTVLAAVDVIEGDFLQAAAGPEGTYMAENINAFEGKVSAAGTLKGDVEGATGDGTLASVRFSVLEPSGEYPLDLFDTHLWMRIENELEEVEHDAVDATWRGPILDFAFIPGEEAYPTREIHAGQTRKLKCHVTNYGYAPVYARVRYTHTREGGDPFSVYSGQHAYTSSPRDPEVYYVNEHIPWVNQWPLTNGTAPWLDEVDGDYIGGNAYCQFVGIFGFEDLDPPLGPADIIANVIMEVYCRTASADDIDLDAYDWNTGGWIDSWYGGDVWGWCSGGRYYGPYTSDRSPALLTEAGFNNYQIVWHYYDPYGLGPGYIDACRLRVTFTGSEPAWVRGTRIMPAQERTTEYATWDLYDFDAGMYVTTVTIEYKQETPDPRFPQYWATAETIYTYTWWCYE
jgi:hypothetical protein